MTARINLNLLPEQKLYLEHLIKELVFTYSCYQDYQKEEKEDRAKKYWERYRKAENLLREEFGLENL